MQRGLDISVETDTFQKRPTDNFKRDQISGLEHQKRHIDNIERDLNTRIETYTNQKRPTGNIKRDQCTCEETYTHQ